MRPFLDQNREVLTHDINNLADVTNTLLQPEPLNGLETALHVASDRRGEHQPDLSPVARLGGRHSGDHDFANPMQFICSSIQAGSRLGYQESAELCAQYLAPILDAIKFNYLPFGLNLFSTAETLPKEVAYSEPRLQPPHGYKDTTVPGIWLPDTPFSHRNNQPGWIVAPGMQGPAGRADHGGPVDAGVAGRTDGWPQHRARPVQPADPAGTAERLRRDTRCCRPWDCRPRCPSSRRHRGRG